MARTKISEFSATAADNTDIDSIDIAEGCAPSGINNAIRELMAQLKDFQTGAAGDPFNGAVNGTLGATTPAAATVTNLAYTGTLTGGTGVINIGSGQVYKDASGNLGLGMTPSAWSGLGTPALQTANGVSLFGFNNGAYLLANAYYNSGYKYVATAAATRYEQSGGAHSWFTAPSGTAGNAITFTQAMTLDADGELGIGLTTPNEKLHVSGAGKFVGQANSLDQAGAFIDYASSVARIVGTGASGGTLAFFTNPNGGFQEERARIDSSGNLSVGGTAGVPIRVYAKGVSTTSGGYSFYADNSAGTAMFYVRNDGLLSSGTGSLSPYNNTTGVGTNMVVGSDGILYRSTSSLKYKTDVQDSTRGLADVMNLRPVTYKGKNDGDTVFGGLIAEEVHEAGLTEFVQYAEDGSPDALAYGNMVSLAFKAIQELKAEFDAYKAAHP